MSKFYECEAEEGSEDDEEEEGEPKKPKGNAFSEYKLAIEKEFYTAEMLEVKTQRLNDKFIDEIYDRYKDYLSSQEDDSEELDNAEPRTSLEQNTGAN